MEGRYPPRGTCANLLSMAEMIPDRLPSSASAGEKRVFSILQKLPDDVIVYYEPVVGERYPDFVVILPTVGLLVIEVKGWYPGRITAANKADVTIDVRGRPEVCKHPIRQARDYMLGLMDNARRLDATAALVHGAGQHAGRFTFPFGHVAILNNCTREQLSDLSLSEFFPSAKVITRDELEVISELDASAILARLQSSFDPWWRFDRLSDRQVNRLRAIIHPEIRISGPSRAQDPEQPDLKVLDIRQERNARSLGEGHRIVYGVAGSGKTVILLARARLVAENRDRKVLVLCFNRALAEYFQEVFAGVTNVTCMNFHAWGSSRNGISYRKGEDEEAYGARLFAQLSAGHGDANLFDAVFVDEAQDFGKSWFACAKLALKEPDDGDLLIVGDGVQSLYRRRRFSWREAGINAVGRTINTRFDLDKNYRNTREILTLAANFVAPPATSSDPETSLQAIAPNPSVAMRSGPKPALLAALNETDEITLAVGKIVAWVNSGLAPRDIAMLYRANTQGWVGRFAKALSVSVPVNWRRQEDTANFRDEDGVFITTIHSAKGLQWRAVLIVRCDTMPFKPALVENPADGERLERGLLYVGMTRAEEFLAFSSSSARGYACEIRNALGG